MEREIIETLM